MLKYNPRDLRENLFIELLTKNRYKVLRHILFLISFFVLIYFARFWHWYSEPYSYYVLLLVFASLITMAYINIYVLVPYLFFKAYYLSYFLFLTLLGVVGLNLIGEGLDAYFSKFRIFRPSEDRGLYEGILMCIPIILTSTTFKLLQKWTNDNRRIAELNTITMDMELKELRNQINPHFLFNMLNNVKALIRTDPEKASTVIIKLSEFLRYQLYDNNEEKTLLSSEIEFLSNFINLEKIRRENFTVKIQTLNDKKVLNSVFVPPNLFTTFVENAIKHSVEIDNKVSYVNIEIEIKDKQLYFICINSKNPNYSISNGDYGGLGLANIKRRLELLYKDQFDLKIHSTHQEYIVNLMFPL